MKDTDITIFFPEHFFNSGEHVFIQMSSEFSEFVGVMHQHAFFEIVYVLSGKAKHVVLDDSYEVSAGDVIIVNPYVTHCFYGVKDTTEPFITYDLMFTPELFDIRDACCADFSVLEESFLFENLFSRDEVSKASIHISPRNITEIGNMFGVIYSEYKRKEQGYRGLIRVYIAELIIKLFKCNIDTKKAVNKYQRDTILIAQKYIKENYSQKLTTEEIATHVCLSSSYFRRLFKKTCGISVSSYVQQTRIEAACRMLLLTDKKISEIAEICCYNDIKFFYQAFKKITGKTPHEYRK